MVFNMITFKELSLPLKFAIVISWVLGILSLIAYIVGFVSGVQSTL